MTCRANSQQGGSAMVDGMQAIRFAPGVPCAILAGSAGRVLNATGAQRASGGVFVDPTIPFALRSDVPEGHIDREGRSKEWTEFSATTYNLQNQRERWRVS
jgi:hypothetical protein